MRVVSRSLPAIVMLILVNVLAKSQPNTFPTSGNTGIGTNSPGQKLVVYGGSSGGSAYAGTFLTLENSGRAILQFLTPNSDDAYILFGSPAAANRAFIGYSNSTNSSADLMQFKTSGVFSFLGGNVGIGTQSPASSLDILRTGTSGYDIFTLHNDQVGNNYGLQMSLKTGGAVRGYFGVAKPSGGTATILSNGLPNAVVLRSEAAMQFGTKGDTVRMTVDTLGNVGVGTSAPDQKLTVSGNVQVLDGQLNFNKSISSHHNTYTQSIAAGISDAIDANNTIAFNLANAAGVISEIMRINGAGCVGIGTMSPSEKLSVNGNIRTKKLIVTQTGWSDYVFDKEYKLRSLPSLENYINQNKHLPEIPSAREVEMKGISVGDNQALLLKKIEELTLYVIALQKQNDALKDNVDRRLKRIETGRNQHKK